MDPPLLTKHLSSSYTEKIGRQGSRESILPSKDSGIHSRTASVRTSQDSTRRSPSHVAASTRSSLKAESLVVPREINFDYDDTATYTSSSTIRDMMKDLDSAPVKEERSDEMYYDSPAVFSPRQSRGMYDSLVMSSGVFPDTDSGFSSSFKGRMQSSEDFTQSPQISPGALVRSRSIPRLNSPFISQEMTPFQNQFRMDRSIRNLQGNLEDSENRRCVLMHKLKEAQDTLELQSERLSKIENAAKGNTILVEDLKLKERDYRRKIDALQLTEQEKEMLKMENIKLRQDMQDRIDKLDFALRSLQAQHQVSENENQKRIVLLEQTGQALSMLENENTRLQQDKDSMKQEMAVAREAIQLARSKFEPMEEENKDLRVQVMRLKEENAELTKKVSELSGQLMELRKLTSSMKDENEKLASSWKTLAEEKQKLSRQLETSQDKAAEMKSRASAAGMEKDRLFQEKMDLNNKYQQLLVNKEQLDRKNCVLEEQVHDAEAELGRAKQMAQKREENSRHTEEELHDLKKANQDLSSELSSVKAYYERALEQIGTLENGKKVQQQQHDWAMQEQERLKAEVDRLGKVAEGKAKELKREKEDMEETIQNLKAELRNMRNDKGLVEDKIEELETKLHKANEDLKYSATVSQEELDTWKDTCDRLTASVSRKESEIQALSEKCLDLEDLTAKLQGENRALKDECEQLSDKQEDVKKMKEENRKLLREKAENEQMIKLLETQKEVLTKSSESQLAKLHDVEQLTSKVEQFRNENEHLRERVLELEKVRDNLVSQKEELLASTELIYKKPKLEELEQKVEELREANRQLREINDTVNDKCESLEQRLTESNLANLPTEQSVSDDQSGSKILTEQVKESVKKPVVSGVATKTPPSKLSLATRVLPYPPPKGKMSVMNSKLGPVLVGEEVVYENDLKPGDDSNIIFDPKFGAVLVSKQELPYSGVGHILVGKRVVRGSKMTKDSDKRKISSKFGPVLMKERVVFEENLKPEEKQKVTVDPVYGKVLVVKEKNPKSITGFTLTGRRVLSASDSVKLGSPGIPEKRFDVKSFSRRHSKSAESRAALEDDHEVMAQTRNQVYVDSAMGPVLVGDEVILDSQLSPADNQKMFFDPQFGNMIVSKRELPGSEIGEIIIGTRVISSTAMDGGIQDMEHSPRQIAKSSANKKFINTHIGPVLMDESVVEEREILPEERENVISIPEVGKVLVKRHSVSGGAVTSVLIGQRVSMTSGIDDSKILESPYGKVLFTEDTVCESEITSVDEEFILHIPEIGQVFICKEVVPTSDTGEILVAKKIVSSGENISVLTDKKVKKPISRPSASGTKQVILESGLGPILLSEQTVLKSDVDPLEEETVVIDPKFGPVLVSKHIVPESELGHVLIGKVIISEDKPEFEGSKFVSYSEKGPILVNGVVLDSEISPTESRNVIDDPVRGKVLITKDMVRDDKLGEVLVGKEVVSPMKNSNGKNVLLDMKDGRAVLTTNVLLESDIHNTDVVIEDPKHGKVCITSATVLDSQGRRLKVGKRVIGGTKVEKIKEGLRQVISDERFGRVEVDDEIVLESDLTAADKSNVIIDQKLGPVLVVKKSGKFGPKFKGRRIASVSNAYTRTSRSKSKDNFVKDKVFGAVEIGDDIIFESEMKPEMEKNIMIHPDFGPVLVTNITKVDPKLGKKRIGKRIVAGKRVPSRGKLITDSQKGKVILGGEVVLRPDLSKQEEMQLVDTEFGPVVLTTQHVQDAKEGKVLLGKRMVIPSSKYDPSSMTKVIMDTKVGPVSIGHQIVLETDLLPEDVTRVIHHETDGDIFVTDETIADPKYGTVFVGKKIVQCKTLPRQGEILIDSKRGPVLVQSEPALESKLNQEERESIILHPELGPVFVSKKVTENSVGTQALVGQRVAFDSTGYITDKSDQNFIEDKDLGLVCVGKDLAFEDDIKSSESSIIYHPKFGALLVTDEVTRDKTGKEAKEAKRIVQGQKQQNIQYQNIQYIESSQGVIAVSEHVVLSDELSQSDRAKVILDPQIGLVMISDETVPDIVHGRIRVGKRLVSPVKHPLGEHFIESTKGPVLVSNRCVCEQDLSPKDRENIVLDSILGPVLITGEKTVVKGDKEMIVGKRVILSNIKKEKGSVIVSDEGKVLLDGVMIDISLTPEDRENITFHPKCGALLVTSHMKNHETEGRLPVAKQIITTMKENEVSKIIRSGKGPCVISSQCIHESDLSQTERESVVLDPLYGPILVTKDIVEDSVNGMVSIGRIVRVNPKPLSSSKAIIEKSKGKVFVGEGVVAEDDLHDEGRSSVVFDPDIGPVLVTKETINTPDGSSCLLGKRLLLSERGAHGEKLIHSKAGEVLVTHNEVKEDSLSDLDRESVIFDPEIGPVLVTAERVADNVVGVAYVGKRVILSRKGPTDKARLRIRNGLVSIAEESVLESSLSEEERRDIVLDPDIGPVVVTAKLEHDPSLGLAFVGKKIIMDKTGSKKNTHKLLYTKQGEVLVSQQAILEDELTELERECVILDSDVGPMVITPKNVEDPICGRVLVGKQVILSQKRPSVKRTVNSQQGTVLIGETSVSEFDLSQAERECIILDPDIGPVLVTKETVVDPQIGFALVGKKVVLGQKDPKSRFIHTSRGKVLVACEEVEDSDLSTTESQNIVLDPQHGPVLITPEVVQDSAVGQALVGKRVSLSVREPSDKIRMMHRRHSVLVGEKTVPESTLSAIERESVVFDPELGPVLVTENTVDDPVTGTAQIGKKVILSSTAKDKKAAIHTDVGNILLSKEAVIESEIKPSERKRIITDKKHGKILINEERVYDPKLGYVTTGKKVLTTSQGKVSSVGKSYCSGSLTSEPVIIQTKVGAVLVGEQVIRESEIESSDRIITDPHLGCVLVSEENVPHKEYGKVLIGKRVIREPRRRSSSLKYLDRVKLSTDNMEQGRAEEIDEILLESPAQFYIESELGPVFVERIFAPGTEKGFVLKGTLSPAQADNIVKTHKNDDVVLETELGPIFIDTRSRVDKSLNFAEMEEVPLEESINIVYIPKGRVLPQIPTATSEIKKHLLISDSTIFSKIARKGTYRDLVSKAVQTFVWPHITIETQTVLDSDAMTFLTGKFYYEENIELKEAIGGDGTVVPKYNLERVKEEKAQLEEELEQVRREYDGLRERHEQYVTDYGPDGEETHKERQKVRQLEREKEGLEKQVALINGQLLLVEGSKKRLDEVVEDLQQEIVHLRKELEEAEKQPVSGPELDQLQTEVDELRGELTRSQKEKIKQEHLVKTLKEELDEERNKKPTKIRESLDDVGTELNEMRGELHKLMGVIQSKDQAIETLENQLRQSKEKIEDKDKAMLELKNIMKDSKGSDAALSAEEPLQRKSSGEEGKSSGASSHVLRKPKESKLIKGLKPAEQFMQMQRSQGSFGSDTDLSKTSVTPGLYGAKYVGSKPQRTQSLTEKGSGDRLQSLISKYRSYGDTGSQIPERKIKPLSLSPSNKMGLVTRGRSFGPAAPKSSENKDGKVSDQSEAEEPPTSPLLPATSPPQVRVTGPDYHEGPLAVSSPTSFLKSKEGPDDSSGVDAQNRQMDRVAVSGETSNLDEDEDGAYGDLDDDDLDTQEQRDINSLIQKQATSPKPILSVNPPKITSKVIGDLLRTSHQSQVPEHHPGSPPMSPDITAANQNQS